VRARSVAARPFTLVQRIQAEAERDGQKRMKELEEALRETQNKLNELQSKKEKGQKAILSKEQQEEIAKFRKKEVEAKKDLKELRKQLRKRVDSLETRVKWLNILGMPLVIALVGVAMAIVKSNRTRAR
jgi:peptidoglycan hydrolase CwlO-like protein